MNNRSSRSLSKIARDEDSFVSGSDIDAQYLDFLNTANEMASQGDIKLGIRLLEDEISERLSRYDSNDKGVWVYSKGIADICNNYASKLISYVQQKNIDNQKSTEDSKVTGSL